MRGEWILVCLAYNVKRLHTLCEGVVPTAALCAVPVIALGRVVGASLASLLGRLVYCLRPRSPACLPALALSPGCRGQADFSPTGC